MSIRSTSRKSIFYKLPNLLHYRTIRTLWKFKTSVGVGFNENWYEFVDHIYAEQTPQIIGYRVVVHSDAAFERNKD